jgi:hypothetical protein
MPLTTNREGNVAPGPPIHTSWNFYTEAYDNRNELRPGLGSSLT